MIASQARATLLAVALMIVSAQSSTAQPTSTVADEHIAFATYFGGSSFDGINGTAMDADGNLVIVGSTNSTDFPVLNAVQPTLGGSFDAFVAKIDPVEGTLLFSTYLGGSATDFFEDVVVDEEGNLYIVGTTESANFPGAAAKAGQADGDAVIVKLSPDGQTLLTERIGGSGAEFGNGIGLLDFDLDGNLDPVITGTTASGNLPLFGPVQHALAGGTDAFVYIIDDTGTPLYGTYAGGTGNETINGRPIVGDFDGDGIDDIGIYGGTDSDDFATRGRTEARRVDPFFSILTSGNAPPGSPFALQVDLFPIDETDPNLLDGDDEAWAATFVGSAMVSSPAPIIAIVGQTNSTAWPAIGEKVLQEAPFANDNTDAFLAGFTIGPPPGLDLEPFYSSPMGGTGDEICRGIDFNGAFFNLNCASGSFLMLEGFPQVGRGPFVQLVLADDFGFVDLFRTGSTNFANMQIQGGGGGSCLGGWSQFGRGITDSLTPPLQSEQSGGFDGFVACTEPAAAFSVTKIPTNTSPLVGEEITYTIRVRAADTLTLHIEDFVRRDELIPTRTTETFSETVEGDERRIAFEPLLIFPGMREEISLSLRVLSSLNGPISNTVRVQDDSGSDVFATATITPRESVVPTIFIVPDNLVRKRSQAVFDIYVDSIRVADDVTAATPFLPATLRRTTPRIDLTDADAPDLSNALASFDIDLLFPHPDSILAFSQTSVILLAGLDSGTPRAVLKHAARTRAVDPTQVEFFVAHIAEGVGPVDVRLLDDTPLHAVVGTVADDLMPDTTSEYTSVRPGGYNLEVTSADGATVLDVFYFDWSGAAGQAFSIALGGEDGVLAVTAVDASGNVTEAARSTAAGAVASSAAHLVLHPGYPNPFLTEVRIAYELPQSATVRLTIFDVLGREVAVLVEDEQTAGHHVKVWNGRGVGGRVLASGIYYCQLQVGERVQERPLLFVR